MFHSHPFKRDTVQQKVVSHQVGIKKSGASSVETVSIWILYQSFGFYSKLGVFQLRDPWHRHGIARTR